MKKIPLKQMEWEMRVVNEPDWLSVRIPGEVHLALMEAGKIPDPFVEDHELDVQWVAEKDWEFRGHIKVSPTMLEEDRIDLVFDGLDTLAEVYFNGTLLGETANAFRQYRWDVKSFCHADENEILVVFKSPVRYVQALQQEMPLPSPDPSIQGGPYLRKAPCQWGWDWGPMLPPIGIWKDVRLEAYSLGRVDSLHLQQVHHHDGCVEVIADAELDLWEEKQLQLCMTLTDTSGKTFAVACKVVDGKARASVKIDAPVLWWPNGYGDQPLYGVRVTLRTAVGEVLDERDFQIGLRTIELRQEQDEYGESFTFVVNGVPVFAKGANWIPADSFPTRISREALDQLLGDAARAHHNMIRVWGGGFYESEDFYDLCDNYGILVWQDFIFSCSVYPLNDPAFVDNVHQEVIENVQRIRHRASLALWCGNNEMDWGWESWGWQKDSLKDYQKAYQAFFYDLLPDWLATLDPNTPYWYSSPTSGTPFENCNSNEVGDAHYWEVWHGFKPFTAYREQFPRFMSEFGFQSLPALKTIQTYANEDHWNLTDYVIEHHQRSDYASAQFMGQMALHFMMPADFPAMVYLTMVLQAEGIRYGVEHWRRNRHRVSGTLYWQLNDCWPVASWSSLDYFGRWKALHYASRRFYAPLLLSIEDDEQTAGMKIHLTSDLMDVWQGQVQWQLMRLDGEILESGEIDCDMPPLSSQMLFEKSFESLTLHEKRETVFVVRLLKYQDILSTQVVPFVRNKHLQLVDPHLKAYLLESADDFVTIELEARYLARFVELSLDKADVVFSDNYFDMLPGEKVRVRCPKPEGWSLDDVGAGLTVYSLYDSFA